MTKKTTITIVNGPQVDVGIRSDVAKPSANISLLLVLLDLEVELLITRSFILSVPDTDNGVLLFKSIFVESVLTLGEEAD